MVARHYQWKAIFISYGRGLDPEFTFFPTNSYAICVEQFCDVKFNQNQNQEKSLSSNMEKICCFISYWYTMNIHVALLTYSAFYISLNVFSDCLKSCVRVIFNNVVVIHVSLPRLISVTFVSSQLPYSFLHILFFPFHCVCLFLCPYTSLASKLFPVWLWCLCFCCFVSFPSFVIAYFHLFSLSLLVPLYLPFCPYPSSVFVCLCTSLGLFSCVFLLSLYVSFFVHTWDCWIFFSLWFFLRCVVLIIVCWMQSGLPSCL